MAQTLIDGDELFVGDVLDLVFEDPLSFVFLRSEDDFLWEVLRDFPQNEVVQTRNGPAYIAILGSVAIERDGTHYAEVTVELRAEMQGGVPYDPVTGKIGEPVPPTQQAGVGAYVFTLAALVALYLANQNLINATLLSREVRAINNGEPGSPPARVQFGEAITIVSLVVGLLGLLYFARKQQ